MRFKIEVTDEKRNPVQLYKDAACMELHDGIGIAFTDTNGMAPPLFLPPPPVDKR